MYFFFLYGLFFIIAAKKPAGTAPVLSEPLQPTEVKEGVAAKLICKVTAEPKPTIEWFKDGVRVKESRRLKLESDGETNSLTINETRSGDKGTYKCVARNDLGSASCSATLTVMVPSKPDFQDKLKGVEVIEGDNVRFDVRVVGYPEPTIEWFKGTSKLKNDGRIEVIESKDQNMYSLVIADAERDDAGMYKCVASNEAGKNTCRADLAVKERLFAPEFSKEESDGPIVVTEGGEVNLNVTINGKPKPVVKWYKDNKNLRESNRLDIKSRGDKYSVVILGVKADDSGVYKCEATSKMGTVTRTFDVQVQGKSVNICSIRILGRTSHPGNSARLREALWLLVVSVHCHWTSKFRCMFIYLC